jgi:spore coat polysaccharide biosynthesis predicted glycosyltransferase SpsG
MNVMLLPEFGKSIGYGHLSRLIAIAEELISRNHHYCFHTDNNSDFVANLMMESSQLSLECRCKVIPDFLLTDSYNVDKLLSGVKIPLGIKLIQLVDDINRPYFSDCYIEASPICEWKPLNLKAPILKFQMSPILRKQFDNAGLDDQGKLSPNFCLLITLGSSPEIVEILKLIVSAIRKSKFSEYRLYISTPSNRSLISKSVLAELEVESIDNLNNAIDIYNRFDLVISACGVTAWELLSANLPCLFIGTIKNQQNQLSYFIENSLADGLMFTRNLLFVQSLISKLNSYSKGFNANNINNGRKKVVDWLESLV